MNPYYESKDGCAVIYHGDCAAVMEAMPGASVDTVVTSPPYNQLGNVPVKLSGLRAEGRHGGFFEKVRAIGYSDDMEEGDYQDWLVMVAEGVARILKPGGSFFFNHKVRYRDSVALHPLDIVRRFAGFSLRQEIIWDRAGATAFNCRCFAPGDERIYWMVRDGAKHFWNQEAARKMTNVWRIRPKVTENHPCPFPIEIPYRCINATTCPGMTVFDPFLGSGTTMVAGYQLGCRVIGAESHAPFLPDTVTRVSAEVAQGNLFKEVAS